MIHDIKVFDKHGKLKEIINGQKCFDEMCLDLAQSPYMMERKKAKETFICRFCKEEFPRHSKLQFCCNKTKCNYQRGLIKNPRKAGREITCCICEKKTIVRHGKAITCGPKCSKERNRRSNLAIGLAYRAKERRERDQLKKERICQK